jgi:hypothetical protein
MGKFEGQIREIAGRLGISGFDDRIDFGGDLAPISANDVAATVCEMFGDQVNCYPGHPGAGCHHVAFFFSLKNPKRAKGRGHLSMEQALDQFIQHMTGKCAGITEDAVIVVDNWDPKAFEKWSHQIRQLASQKNVEIYLVAIDSVVRIPV